MVFSGDSSSFIEKDKVSNTIRCGYFEAGSRSMLTNLETTKFYRVHDDTKTCGNDPNSNDTSNGDRGGSYTLLTLFSTLAYQ